MFVDRAQVANLYGSNVNITQSRLFKVFVGPKTFYSLLKLSNNISVYPMDGRLTEIQTCVRGVRIKRIIRRYH